MSDRSFKPTDTALVKAMKDKIVELLEEGIPPIADELRVLRQRMLHDTAQFLSEKMAEEFTKTITEAAERSALKIAVLLSRHDKKPVS
jgi:hypothetical protein